ncbi:hypothetical protein ARSEF1564_009749 [Beauveria bassiana]
MLREVFVSQKNPGSAAANALPTWISKAKEQYRAIRSNAETICLHLTKHRVDPRDFGIKAKSDVPESFIRAVSGAHPAVAKFAQTMSAADEADSEAIEESNLQEMQAVRALALGFNEDGPMPSSAMLQVEPESIGYENALHVGSDDGCGTIAGPSGQHSNQQDIVLGKSAVKPVECVVCGEHALPHNAVDLKCGDTFCRPCLKSFFMRVAKDETLFPPKCPPSYRYLCYRRRLFT